MDAQTCPRCGIRKPAKKGQFDRHDPACNNRERCDAREKAKRGRD